jgi:hypothetical protein
MMGHIGKLSLFLFPLAQLSSNLMKSWVVFDARLLSCVSTVWHQKEGRRVPVVQDCSTETIHVNMQHELGAKMQQGWYPCFSRLQGLIFFGFNYPMSICSCVEFGPLCHQHPSRCYGDQATHH